MSTIMSRLLYQSANPGNFSLIYLVMYYDNYASKSCKQPNLPFDMEFWLWMTEGWVIANLSPL